jgi:hypothetical protein
MKLMRKSPWPSWMSGLGPRVHESYAVGNQFLDVVAIHNLARTPITMFESLGRASKINN